MKFYKIAIGFLACTLLIGNASSSNFGSGAFNYIGAQGGGSSGFIPDPDPTPYRTTTQTMVSGRRSTSANAFIPTLSSEFSISVWFRSTSTLGGVAFNFYDPNATSGSASFGGSTFQGMALDFGGNTPGDSLQNNYFTLTGTDKDGNHIAAGTVTGGSSSVTAYGYKTVETTVSNSTYAMLLTVQYRSGNIELWATYRGMVPRLLMSHAATWNGTSQPLPFWIGGGNYSVTGNGVFEMEMPIVIPDRSLSLNEIAQLADGINPETLGGTSGHASAAIRFSNITTGGSAGPDVVAFSTLSDGQTITLNSDVYTLRSSPSLPTDIQFYPNVTATSITSATDIINITANTIPNDRRVAVRSTGVQPPNVDPDYAYYVVNSTGTGIQLSKTVGGAVVDIGAGTTGTITVAGIPGTLDNLVTALNALTPNTGGASNATYSAPYADQLFITARTANVATFTLATSITARLPAAARVALAWAVVTDYTNYYVGLLGSPGATRRRSVAWVAPLGTYLAPNVPVSGSVLLRSWTSGTVSQHLNGTGYLALSGIYTGNPPTDGAQFSFYNQADSTLVQAYASLSSFVYDATAKTWSGKITVPKGKRWLLNESKKTGNTQQTQLSEVKHGVGEIAIMMGRSIQARMPSLMNASAVTPNGFVTRFSGLDYQSKGLLGSTSGSLPLDNTWHIFQSNDPATSLYVSGAGEAVFANLVSESGDAVVGIINRSVGGASFAGLTDSATFDSLTLDLSNNFTDTSLAPPAAVYDWLHSQECPYYTLLDQLYTKVTAAFGTQIDLAVVTSSNFWAAPDGTTLLACSRVDQISWLQSPLAGSHTVTPAVWDYARIIDNGDASYFWSNDPNQWVGACGAAPDADGVHPCSYTDTQLLGNTRAQSFLKMRGLVTYSGVGPTPISVTRSGVNIDVTFSLNGATGMQTLNVGDVSGFDVALASNNFTATSSSVTATALTDLINWTSTPVVNGDTILISSTNGVGSVPGGLVSGQTYYAVNKAASNFQLSATPCITPCATPVDITSAGTNVVATDTAALLSISSVSIISATTVRIALAADPGAPVAVNVNWGRPGRQSSDPVSTASARATLSNFLVDTSIGNILVDNFALTYVDAHTLGRPARGTPTPLVSN